MPDNVVYGPLGPLTMPFEFKDEFKAVREHRDQPDHPDVIALLDPARNDTARLYLHKFALVRILEYRVDATYTPDQLTGIVSDALDGLGCDFSLTLYGQAWVSIRRSFPQLRGD